MAFVVLLLCDITYSRKRPSSGGRAPTSSTMRSNLLAKLCSFPGGMSSQDTIASQHHPRMEMGSSPPNRGSCVIGRRLPHWLALQRKSHRLPPPCGRRRRQSVWTKEGNSPIVRLSDPPGQIKFSCIKISLALKGALGFLDTRIGQRSLAIFLAIGLLPLAGGSLASSTRTQSPSPSALLPGGMK